MQKDCRSLRVAPLGRGRRYALDADEIVAAALRRSGRRDFSDRSFLVALQRLLAACNAEADLTALGRFAVRRDILRCLKNLLRLDAVEERDPSVIARPLERPLFITGMPRSGTTFLHRLLLQDPAAAAPLLWQLVYPCPRSKVWAGAELCRIGVAAQVSLFRLLAPELNALHPVSAAAPEECSDITAQVFQSLRFENVYRVPAYRRWLERRGHREAYRFHRRFLQHLDAQMPGRRWILKCPDHVFALEDIRAVYPDARIVFIHRDPVRVMASVAKLTEVLRRPFTRSVSPAEIGRQVSACWIEGAERMVHAAAGPEPILHLRYSQIMADPMSAVRAVLRHAGATLSPEAEERMRHWLRGAAARRGGAPRRYDLATFGLDPHALRAQFARYTERFEVPLEWEARAAGGASWV